VGTFYRGRLFGVRVDVFSIGFGPRLFGWKRGARITGERLPLGGYVRMAGQTIGDRFRTQHFDSRHRERENPGTEKDEKQLQALGTARRTN